MGDPRPGGELVESGRSSRRDDEVVRVGDWFWVKSDDGEDEWLGCVTHVGTNYARVESPGDGRSTRHVRILLAELWDRCRREPDAAAVIAANVARCRETIASAVRELGEVATRLRLGEATQDSDVRALATYDGASAREYGERLALAKREDIPAIQERVERASEEMRAWMVAETLPLLGEKRRVKEVLDAVDARISGVEVYAGLVEHLVQVRGGDPAAEDEPLYLRQRRHYMDEECLANWQAGGMTFKDLAEFERWFLLPVNLDRVMPERRCAVAFKVRRQEKESDVLEEFVSLLFGRKDDDARTFLYLRNGDQVHRLETALEFGEKLFPDAERSVLRRGKLYGVMFAGQVDRLATEGEYLDLLRREAEQKRKYDEAPEDEKWRYSSHFSDRWVPWDDTSVYFDDVTDSVRRTMTEHNRLVLLLQGILDRSCALSPHPPCRLWLVEDFARQVRLVFDDDRALVPGEAPDFEAYRRACNRYLARGCRTVGQEDFWMLREAERENDRLIRMYGHRSNHRLSKRLRPDGDPGPGAVAEVVDYSASRGCSYTWTRKARTVRRWEDDFRDVRARLVVPASHLLCVEGYRPGDYHLFYDDPRTRAEYVKWAPLLLRAEEWYVGGGRR